MACVTSRAPKIVKGIRSNPVRRPAIKRVFGSAPFFVWIRGTNPSKKKTSVAAKAIVTALVKNNNAAPPAMSHRPSAMPMPIVESGGMRAVAIATPGNAAERCGCAMEYAAARPPASAISKSFGVGWVRLSTSRGISCRDGTNGR